MPIEIEVDGELYEFPDDATDAEIQAALGGQSSPEPAIKPMASHSPSQPAAPRTWGDEAIDVGKGVGQGLLRTGSTLAGMFTGAPTAEFYEPITRPRNTAQTVGNVISDIGTAAIPMARIGQLGRAASAATGMSSKIVPSVVRGLVNAGGGATVAAAQGYDPEAGALGALLPEAAGVGGKAARGVARAITGAGDDVADAALKHRVLPGIIRSGHKKAERAIEARAGDVREVVTPSPATIQGVMPPAGVRASTGRHMQEALTKAEQQADNIDRLAARKLAGKTTYKLSQKPYSASDFFEMSEGSRKKALGKSNVASDVRRAASADMRVKLANVVPEATRPLRAISELAPVTEAYARRFGGAENTINPKGAPTLQTRLIVGTINRLLGPSAQGLHNVSQLGQSELSRLALMAMLEQSMKGRD